MILLDVWTCTNNGELTDEVFLDCSEELQNALLIYSKRGHSVQCSFIIRETINNRRGADVPVVVVPNSDVLFTSIQNIYVPVDDERQALHTGSN
jgi:hypothetical protein